MRDAPFRGSARTPFQTLTESMRELQGGAAAAKPLAVQDLVTAVLDTMDGRLSAGETVLLQEVAGLGRIIEQARAGIAEVSVGAIMGSHIPSATDELGAIVEHTATATLQILESCEMLDSLSETLEPSQQATLQMATTRIYEACSFQDITGQRITKVVAALQAIEARVLALSHSYGLTTAAPERRPAAFGDGLMNGPALPQNAMGQDDIDKLLADFG